MTVIRSGALRPGPPPHISYNIRTTDPRLYALGRSALVGPGDRADPRVSAWRGQRADLGAKKKRIKTIDTA